MQDNLYNSFLVLETTANASVSAMQGISDNAGNDDNSAPLVCCIVFAVALLGFRLGVMMWRQDPEGFAKSCCPPSQLCVRTTERDELRAS